MDCSFKRVDPHLLHSLLDPFTFNDVWSKINKASAASIRQTSASCEDFLSHSPKGRLTQDDSHSLDMLESYLPAVKWTDTGIKEVTVIKDILSLLFDIIN